MRYEPDRIYTIEEVTEHFTKYRSQLDADAKVEGWIEYSKNHPHTYAALVFTLSKNIN